MVIWSGAGVLFLFAWAAVYFALSRLVGVGPALALLIIAAVNGFVTLRSDADPAFGTLFFIPVGYWTFIIGAYGLWVLFTGAQITNFI